MKIPQSNNQEKKAYTKPVLNHIDLRPEEAVLGNCKTGMTGTGPANSNCVTPVCNVTGT